MKQIKVKLVRSRIGTTPHQRKMLDSLGLKKINTERIFNDSSAIRGIIDKLNHLVSCSEVLEDSKTPDSSSKTAVNTDLSREKAEKETGVTSEQEEKASV